MPKSAVSRKQSKQLTKLEERRARLVIFENRLRELRLALTKDLPILDFIALTHREHELVRVMAESRNIRNAIKKAEDKLREKAL